MSFEDNMHNSIRKTENIMRETKSYIKGGRGDTRFLINAPLKRSENVPIDQQLKEVDRWNKNRPGRPPERLSPQGTEALQGLSPELITQYNTSNETGKDLENLIRSDHPTLSEREIRSLRKVRDLVKEQKTLQEQIVALNEQEQHVKKLETDLLGGRNLAALGQEEQKLLSKSKKIEEQLGKSIKIREIRVKTIDGLLQGNRVQVSKQEIKVEEQDKPIDIEAGSPNPLHELSDKLTQKDQAIKDLQAKIAENDQKLQKTLDKHNNELTQKDELIKSLKAEGAENDQKLQKTLDKHNNELTQKDQTIKVLQVEIAEKNQQLQRITAERNQLIQQRFKLERNPVSRAMEWMEHEKLKPEDAQKLEQLRNDVVELHRQGGSATVDLVGTTAKKDKELAVQIQNRRNELKQIHQEMDESQFENLLEKDLQFKQFQTKRTTNLEKLIKQAQDLQDKMERKYGEEMDILEKRTNILSREKGEGGVIFKFRDSVDADFRMAVAEWVKRKQGNLDNALHLDLSQRLEIRYQSNEKEPYNYTQELAKWHLTLIEILQKETYTKYKDFSSGRPTITNHIGKEAEKDRQELWDALAKNAKTLAEFANKVPPITPPSSIRFLQ